MSILDLKQLVNAIANKSDKRHSRDERQMFADQKLLPDFRHIYGDFIQI